MPTKKEKFEETRQKLMTLARASFASKGYADTATNDLVAAAGLTRGALYYQFRDKRDLFRAVFVAAQRDIAAEIARAATAAPDPWSALVVGCKTFIAASARPDTRRIVLIDGPAVLGWDEWRRIDAEQGTALLLQGLEACAAAGELRPVPLVPLCHLLTGALNEAALALAAQPDDAALGRGIAQAIEALLAGLRQPRG